MDGTLNNQVPGAEVSSGLVFPGNVKLGVGGRCEPVILYVSGNADDGAPLRLQSKAERFSQGIFSIGEELFRERLAKDHRPFRGRAVLFAKASAAQDRDTQRRKITRRDEAITNHSASARTEFCVPGNFEGR